MSDIPSPSEEQQPHPETVTQSFDRYDLTGSSITHWTTNARARLVDAIRRITSTSDEVDLDSIIELLDSRDEAPVQKQLEHSLTETEFLKQELLRQQINEAKARARGQQLDNAAKEIEIRHRLQDLTQGRADIHFVQGPDGIMVVIGKLPTGANATGQIHGKL